MFKIYLGIVLVSMWFHVPLADNVTEEVKHPAYYKEVWEKHEYPNPMTDDGSWACGNRGKKYYLCDPSRELLEPEAFAISSLISRWHSIARCPCLNCLRRGPYYIIMVAIVPKIKEQPGLSKLDVTLQFAEYLSTDAWNFARCEDSVIIVLSVADKSLWTAVGKKVKDLLTKTCIGDIFEENKGLLASGLFGKAVENLVAEYIAVLKEDRDCSFEWPSWWKFPAIVIVTIIIFLFFGDQVSSYVFHRRLFTCMDELLRKGRVTRPGRETIRRQPEPVRSSTSVHTIYNADNPPVVHDIVPVNEIESVTYEEDTESSSSSQDCNRLVFFITDGQTGSFQPETTGSSDYDLDSRGSSHISIGHRRY